MAEAIKMGGGISKIPNGQIVECYAKDEDVKVNTFVEETTSLIDTIVHKDSITTSGTRICSNYGMFENNDLLEMFQINNVPNTYYLQIYKYDNTTKKHSMNPSTALSFTGDSPYYNIDIAIMGDLILAVRIEKNKNTYPDTYLPLLYVFKRNVDTGVITVLKQHYLNSINLYSIGSGNRIYFSIRVLNSNKFVFGLNYNNNNEKPSWTKRLILYTIDSTTGDLSSVNPLVNEGSANFSANYITDGYPKFALITTSDKKYIICYFGINESYTDVKEYYFDENGNQYTKSSESISPISFNNDNTPVWGGVQYIDDNTYLAFHTSSKNLINVFTFNETNKTFSSKTITSSIFDTYVRRWFFIKNYNNDLYYMIVTNTYKLIQIHTSDLNNISVTLLGTSFNRMLPTERTLPISTATFNEYNIRQVSENISENLISWIYYLSGNINIVYNERVSLYERWLDDTPMVSIKTTNGVLKGLTKTKCKKFKKGKVAVPL